MTQRCIHSAQSPFLPAEAFLNRGLLPWLRRGALISGAQPQKDLIVGWGELQRAPQAEGPHFFTPDFFLEDSKPAWVFQHYSVIPQTELSRALKAQAPDWPPLEWPTLQWKEARRSGFQKDFAILADRFRQGTLAKAVPIISDHAPWPEKPSSEQVKASWVLHALEYSQSAPVFLYGAWNGEEGILGATPELLIRQESENRYSTVALAGTRREAERATRPSLLDDPKERREHQLVIDGIEKALGPFGKIQVGETHELMLPGLSHLKTEISLETQSRIPLPSLVRALHPTPALGASPREQGAEILRLLDRQQAIPRRRFGAPFGFSSHDSGLAVVAIRNLQWTSREITASAGCGVIAESEESREWLELRAKLASVRRIFGV